MHEIEFCQQVVVNRSQLRISGYGNLNNYFVKKILTWMNRIDRIKKMNDDQKIFWRRSSFKYGYIFPDGSGSSTKYLFVNTLKAM
jgi:hypothetical protein